MANNFIDLDFRKPDPKFPGPAVAQIYVRRYAKDENFDWPIISAQCYTFKELVYQIKRLEDDLKAIRQKARKKFQAVK